MKTKKLNCPAVQCCIYRLGKGGKKEDSDPHLDTKKRRSQIWVPLRTKLPWFLHLFFYILYTCFDTLLSKSLFKNHPTRKSSHSKSLCLPFRVIRDKYNTAAVGHTRLKVIKSLKKNRRSEQTDITTKEHAYIQYFTFT